MKVSCRRQLVPLCLLMVALAAAGRAPARADAASDYSDAVFAATIAARVANGLVALTRDARLDAAGLGWLQVIAPRNQLVHELPGFPSAGQRILNQGYNFQLFGENLAFGFPTAEERTVLAGAGAGAHGGRFARSEERRTERSGRP